MTRVSVTMFMDRFLIDSETLNCSTYKFMIQTVFNYEREAARNKLQTTEIRSRLRPQTKI